MFRIFLLALAYLVAGWLGLQIPSIGTHITLVWLPAGIAVAALLRWGWTLWPGIFLGAFLVNFAIGSSWLLAAGIALGNTLGPLLAVWFLKRIGFHSALDRLRDVGLLIIAASVGMTVSALCGVVNLYLAGLLPLASMGSAWLTWWMGDTVGVLLTAPFVLTLTRATGNQLHHSHTEILLWISTAGVAIWFAFVHDYASTERSLPLAFITLPFLAWAALRFGSSGAALATMFFSVTAAWSTANGRGPFNVSDNPISLFLLWSYMATAVVTGLLITAMQAGRSRAERELHESEQRMRLATATTGVGIWEWNVLTNKVRWDAQMFRLYGISPTEDGYVDYSTWAACVLPEELPDQEKIMQDAIRQKSKSAREFRIRRTNDGEWRRIQAMEATRTNEQGQVEWVVGTNLDITGRQQAELARTQLAAIVENSNDAIMSRALDGTILTWNAGAERLLGYTAAEAIGRVSDFLIPPGRKPNRIPNTEALLRGETVLAETYRLTKDGRTIAVLSSQSPIRDAYGKIVGASIILQDITERNLAIAKLRQSEAFNDSVLNSLSAHVAVLDHNGVIISVNDSWRTFARGNDAPVNLVNPIGVNYLDVCHRSSGLHHGEEASAVETGIRAVLRGEQPSFLREYPCHSPYEPRWFQLRVTPLQGSRSGAVISHESITSRKMAEAARAALEVQLRESQKMEAIGKLAGGIAHDFNNALATILGNAELARQDSAHNPPALESLEEIRKAGTRARNLVQQILAFSRRQPVDKKAINLAPVVLEATRLLRATVPARLSLDVRCDEVPPVLADVSQIEQMLINLATNAMQAMRSGPGRIGMRLDTVTVDAALAGAHLALAALHARHQELTVRITVSDTGPGMDAATKERIFEPFFTTKPVGEGTGLGLSVVHGIVQGHEGVITVDSEPGKGTTFTVYLPVAAVGVDVGASTQPLDPGTTASPSALSLDGGCTFFTWMMMSHWCFWSIVCLSGAGTASPPATGKMRRYMRCALTRTPLT